MNEEKAKQRFFKMLDMSQVDREDRDTVRTILWGLARFEDPLPEFEVKIYGVGDHYNARIEGWNCRIDDRLWYETYLDRDRVQEFDHIISTSTIPGLNGITIKIVTIAKTGTNANLFRQPVDEQRDVQQYTIGKKLTADLEMKEVDRADHNIVESIVWGIITFQAKMPKLDIKIFATRDNYCVTFEGWNTDIDDTRWFKTYLDTKSRSRVYDPIIKTMTVPAADNENENVAVKIVTILKVGSNSLKRK